MSHSLTYVQPKEIYKFYPSPPSFTPLSSPAILHPQSFNFVKDSLRLMMPFLSYPFLYLCGLHSITYWVETREVSFICILFDSLNKVNYANDWMYGTISGDMFSRQQTYFSVRIYICKNNKFLH